MPDDRSAAALVTQLYERDHGPFALASDPDEVLSEDLVAEIFVRLHGDELRFDHHAGRWFAWQGSHWRRQDTGAATEMVRNVARRAAQNATSDSKAAAMRKAAFVAGAERLAQTDQRVAVTSEAWESDPFLLGTPGGTVDLRSGEMRAADPGDGLTKLSAVAPAETPDCDRWLRFLDDATGRDDDLIEFLQLVMGYCLTGDTREHALFFVYGDGGNGKSVFLNTFAGILGDYATTAAMDTFTASHHDRHATELARLQGARLVSASETEEGRAWAESRIKQLTGGDRIAARFMRRDFFEFSPVFKLLIVGNHRPVLRNVDEAARRRFRLIPFTRKPPSVDKELEAKLRDEWPGILRWAIEGCQKWLDAGLNEPAAVVDATSAYFEDQDTMGAWLEERCTTGAHEFEEKAKLFTDWSEYARAAGENPGTRKAFNDAMVKRGFVPTKARIGSRIPPVFRGVAFSFDPAASGINHD